MLSKSSPVYLAIPNAQNKRLLHEGRVLEIDARRVVIEFDDAIAPTAGSEVMLFAEVRGKFFQQGATVTQPRQDAPRPTIELHTVGDPVSAEQRGSYRTSVIAWKVPVKVDKLVGCMLADVSPEGVGIISPKPLTVGTTVNVGLDFEGHVITGPFRVQTAKILPTGAIRFGLFVSENRSPMRAQLQRLSGHVQRAQLKRISGAA